MEQPKQPEKQAPTPPALPEPKSRDLLLEQLNRDQAAWLQAYRDNTNLEVPY